MGRSGRPAPPPPRQHIPDPQAPTTTPATQNPRQQRLHTPHSTSHPPPPSPPPPREKGRLVLPSLGSSPAGRGTSWRRRSPAGGGSGEPTAGRTRSRSGCTRKAFRPCGSSGADSGCPVACSSGRTRYTRTAAPRHSPPPNPGGHQLHPPTARPHPPAATHTP